ncbi:MAG: prepilin peptidase [Actinomycetota bacterium]|nr:prepilin peptidase [Actinomycetota bacterium]MDA8367870.1 prepilin peptidase [Actinomycetota bacterium]
MTVVAVAVTVGFLVGPWLRTAIFANRLPRGDPAHGHCPHCSRLVLASGDLGIVGPVALSGRCPSCRRRIGAPPVIIEVVSAGVSGLLALRVHPPLVLAALVWAAAAGIVLVAIDASTRRLPDAVLAPTLVVVLVLLVVAGLVDHRSSELVGALIGGAATFAGYSLLALVTAGLGFGDCKLAALLGLVLGWFGWEPLAAGVTLGFLLAACYLLARMVIGRFSPSEQIPLAPFMLVGAFTVLLVVA